MSDNAATLVTRAYDAIVALHGPPPVSSSARRAWFRRHHGEMRAMVAEMRAEP